MNFGQIEGFCPSVRRDSQPCYTVSKKHAKRDIFHNPLSIRNKAQFSIDFALCALSLFYVAVFLFGKDVLGIRKWSMKRDCCSVHVMNFPLLELNMLLLYCYVLKIGHNLCTSFFLWQVRKRQGQPRRTQKIGQAKTLGGADNVLIFNQPLRVNSVRLQNKLESKADWVAEERASEASA